MRKLILRPANLNFSGKRKEINDLTIDDFRVPRMQFYLAEKVLYIEKNRVRILKNRYPKGYKPREITFNF